MKVIRLTLLLLAGILSLINLDGANFRAPVKIWQTTEVIPTYLAEDPSDIPRFYSGRTYQGAKATFYPYPVQDKLTDVKTNKVYKVLYLENEYIKLSVLPELGGRIFSAVDKSNGYEFFYRQSVIKPALIGMLGAWISGGVEWNVPHHHRATSFMPVEYSMRSNPDGSATIWVGETEIRHRMRWLVGITLYPEYSYIELSCKIFNRTPFAHPILFWINPAVYANENYQVIFPPSTEWAAQHAKPEFASWQIARQFYGGVDYTRGVDISWWNNHPSPVSFFAWNYQDDWFGGYDHGRESGVLHVADHKIAPGKKFFEWGNGQEGEMWSKVLSDKDGPYLELMAGAWSDNQPDYSWLNAGQTREWKHYWYPIKKMGGVKSANKNFALNLQFTNGFVQVYVNSTHPYPKARLLVGSTENSNIYTIVNTNFYISPAKPFFTQAKIKEPVEPTNYFVTVYSGDGEAQLTYQPAKPSGSPMPSPVERPKNPKDYATIDELYYIAQRIEQLYNPAFEPQPYYLEILRRDPGEYRANTAMGALLCKQWRWAEAEKYLRTAIARASANYINPKDVEAYYYLGVAIRGQLSTPRNSGESVISFREWLKKCQDAIEAFSKAAWSQQWQAAASFQVAELECQLALVHPPSGFVSNFPLGKERFENALDWLERSIAANYRNPTALKLKSAILRRLGHFEQAEQICRLAMEIDPLDVGLKLEYALVKNKIGNNCARLLKKPTKLPLELFTCNVWTRLEIATDYGNARFFDEAILALLSGVNQNEPAAPLVAYSLTFCSDKQNEIEKPINTVRFRMPGAYDFPFQHESTEVLEFIINRNDADIVAPYLLGCLLYDNQPEQAIKWFETAIARINKNLVQSNDAALNYINSLTRRALALAYAQHQKDNRKAIVLMEQAVTLRPGDPRFLYELDVLYESAGIPVKQRLQWLARDFSVTSRRDDAITRLILVYLADGQLNRAIEILRTHRFHNWEGSSEIRNIYVDARLMRGLELLRSGKPQAALQDFTAALEYPENLEVGRPKRDYKAAQIYYHIALAYEVLGDAEKAKEFYTKSADSIEAGASEPRYFRALALKKLGRTDEANRLFESLIKQGSELLTREPADYFAKFGERRPERVRKADAHYLSALGYLGLGKDKEAENEFKQTLELHPAHIGALTYGQIKNL